VYVMKADGSGQVNISQSPSADYSPAWSPDGALIAFASTRDKGAGLDIWVMRPDGSGARRVTQAPGIQEYPSWSPDGRQLAFHCTLGRVLPSGVGDFEICVVNLDGTGFQQLTDAPGVSQLPAWSPDGLRLAFESDREGWPSLPEYLPPGYEPERYGDEEIFVMGVDGSEPVNVSREPHEDDSMPAWSPDGDLIFSRYGCLMVLPAEGGEPYKITSGPCADAFPDWRRAAH
jgi:Tol biopolymer transport system component